MELIHDEISKEIIETAKVLAKEKSVGKITVRDILKALNLTNRVFYNRFHNIEEVFEILYTESVHRVRESISADWDENTDFGEHIRKVAVQTLILTYESRQNMSQFVFEADSITNTNYEWWASEIRNLIHTGKEIGYFKEDLDEEAIGYSLWCFIRGFNADALSRNLPLEDALNQFKCGFGCFIEGMRK